MTMTAALAFLAPGRWPLGSGQGGFPPPVAPRRSGPPSQPLAVAESAHPKVFFAPCHFSVYMLLTLENIYTILLTSAREIDMAHHEIQIANLEAQIAKAIAADDWQMFDFLSGLLAPHLAKRVVR